MTSAIKSWMSKPSPRALITGAVLLVGVLLATLLLPFILQDLGYAQGPVEAIKVEKEFPENSAAAVTRFEATDPEGQPIRWELSGDDGLDFDITGGELTFNVIPDYENPADRNRDNIYEVTVSAKDPGSNEAPADVTITVLNMDEPGIVDLSSEDPREEVRLVAELADPDGVRTQPEWQWSRSSDGEIGWVDISGATAGNYTPVEADVGSYLRATASYEDAESEDESKVAQGITANPVLAKPHVNSPPEFLDRSPERTVNENADAGTPVGNPVAAEDPDDDNLVYSLSGQDIGSFEINIDTGQISVPAGTALDFEVKSSYSVTVTAVDPSGENDSVDVTITVADVNEPPDVTEGETDLEYAENGTDVVEQFVAVDPEGQDVSWRLSGDDVNDFSITDGAVAFTSSPDFENPADRGSNNVYNITVGASDTGGRLTEVDVTVAVTNVDEPGTVTLSTDQPEEGVRMSAALDDPDYKVGTTAWQWSRSSDGATGWIDIPNATGGFYTPNVTVVGLYLQATATYNDRESALTTRTASRATANPVLATGEVNSAPRFLDRSPERFVNENAAANAPVGDPVAAEDEDGDTLTYSMSGTDADSFDINEDTGQISVADGTALDYETKTSYEVSVEATDPEGASDSVNVAIMVNDVDEPPSFTVDNTELEYAENGTASVTTFSATDPEGGDIGWALSGDDADLFSISGGALTFNDSPDFEAPADEDVDNVYDLTIGASDPEGNLTEVDITVTVANVDESGTVTLSSLEPEEGVRLTVTLADPDGISSRISWQWARSTDGVSGWIDIEDTASGIYIPTSDDADYYLRATASYEDRQSDTVTKTANAATDEPVVGIPHVNRAPQFVDPDPTTREVIENSGESAVVGNPVGAEDADNDVLVYTISGDDAELFSVIEATGQVTVGAGASLDFEARTSYEVTLTVSDPSGATDSINVEIEVTDEDESPKIIEVPPGPERTDEGAFEENSTRAVGTYTVGGQTQGYEWSLSGIDADNFSITDGVLTFNSAPDYENPTDQDRNNVYHINVHATDSEGRVGTSSVTITVVDLDDTPDSAAGRYDANGDGAIDRSEALTAIRDYFNDDHNQGSGTVRHHALLHRIT